MTAVDPNPTFPVSHWVPLAYRGRAVYVESYVTLYDVRPGRAPVPAFPKAWR